MAPPIFKTVMVPFDWIYLV